MGEQGHQAPSPASAAAPESNYPSTASNGQKEPAQDEAHVHVAETSVAPPPAVKKPKKAEPAMPKAPTKKAPDAKPATKTAPKKSAPEVYTHVVPDPETQSATVDEDEDEPDAWDNLGDLLRYLTPFLAALPPTFLPDMASESFEPFSDIGQTLQPDKLERLPSVELPSAPISTDPQPETFVG
ncbi:hypothetical protein [Streptomyces coelicoflavus]|uniref:Uncharacterized protein n=1 Tax=Streptomyces coelicoflavus TaxID=285562 RepID=A0A6N9UQW0_9ACTN|nr:hypothetical protein [Streptomyces coelicoflavus]NEB19964.1 hypothetical protein [Streptomyces coelicoflavus]